MTMLSEDYIHFLGNCCGELWLGFTTGPLGPTKNCLLAPGVLSESPMVGASPALGQYTLSAQL